MVATRRGKSKRSKAPRRVTPREARIRRERKQLGANVNYQYWIVGFADREAGRVGKRPSEQAVRRNPEFQKLVDTILGHDPKKKYAANSKLARALVAVGVRDPSYRGNVGNSPGRGDRVKRRQSQPKGGGGYRSSAKRRRTHYGVARGRES